MKKLRSGLALNRTRSGLGFTIIELMVVVLIIAILASVVIVTLESGKLKARDAQRKADLALIATSLENYRVDKKGYPASTDFCNIGEELGKCLYTAEFLKYQVSLPTDPSSTDLGNKYYKYKSVGTQFKITAQSEGITSTSSGSCTTGEIKQKAGDYCDSKDTTRFQISSSIGAKDWK